MVTPEIASAILKLVALDSRAALGGLDASNMQDGQIVEASFWIPDCERILAAPDLLKCYMRDAVEALLNGGGDAAGDRVALIPFAPLAAGVEFRALMIYQPDRLSQQFTLQVRRPEAA